jgi:hypothetical protein
LDSSIRQNLLDRPLAPLEKGGNQEKVPLNKGDLGGSKTFKTGSKAKKLKLT